MNIGFIGLGLMGRPMAQNLARAGHQLHLWARRPESLVPFQASTAKCHDNPAQVAAASDVVFTMVADAPDVEAVALGSGGVAEGGRPGLVLVDMSTIGSQAARSISARLLAYGIDMLDAPVSGGEVGAINATLSIMVGGKEAVFERVRPLFECMGKTVSYIGESGAGQVAKACNQILTGVGVAAVAEALALAQKSGVSPARVREALMGGFAQSRILENHGQRMLDGNFKPGFKAWMHRKDLHIVLDEARALGLDLHGTAAVAQMYDELVAGGLGEEDSVVMFKSVGGVGAAPVDEGL